MKTLTAPLSLALALSVSGVFASAPASAAAADAYYCEEPKQVSVPGHTLTTPRICVPVP